MKHCWYCNKKFRGNHKTEILNKTPSYAQQVYVHKQCAEEMVECGDISSYQVIKKPTATDSQAGGQDGI